MEEKKIVEKQEKKSKKGLIIGLIIGGAVLLITAIVFLLLFLLKPTYKVTVNTGGKKLIKNIVVAENEIKKLPEIELSKSEYLVAWVNDDGEAIRPGLPIDRDTGIKPIIGDPMKEKVILKFVTGIELEIPDIIIEKGAKVILPVAPTHNAWKFLNWVDENGFVIPKDKIITEDTTIYAYWFKAGPDWGDGTYEEVTVSFETGTKEKIDSIKLVKGSNYLFPIPEEKNGDKIFKGWLDPDGKLLTKENKVEKDIILTAKWVEPYTCPENCTPSEDGKTCTKKDVRDMEHSSECIDPYEVVNGKCLDTANKFDPWSSGDDGLCPSGTYQWDICWGMGCERYCAKEVGFESGSWCPEGYTEENNKCVKIETVECTKN